MLMATHHFWSRVTMTSILLKSHKGPLSPMMFTRKALWDMVKQVRCAGGGHALIGLHLAKQLLGAGHSVTILNDGDQVQSLPRILMLWQTAKAPFAHGKGC